MNQIATFNDPTKVNHGGFNILNPPQYLIYHINKIYFLVLAHSEVLSSLLLVLLPPPPHPHHLLEGGAEWMNSSSTTDEDLFHSKA